MDLTLEHSLNKMGAESVTFLSEIIVEPMPDRKAYSNDRRVSDGADIVPFRVSRPGRSVQVPPKEYREIPLVC